MATREESAEFGLLGYLGVALAGEPPPASNNDNDASTPPPPPPAPGANASPPPVAVLHQRSPPPRPTPTQPATPVAPPPPPPPPARRKPSLHVQLPVTPVQQPQQQQQRQAVTAAPPMYTGKRHLHGARGAQSVMTDILQPQRATPRAGSDTGGYAATGGGAAYRTPRTTPGRQEWDARIVLGADAVVHAEAECVTDPSVTMKRRVHAAPWSPKRVSSFFKHDDSHGGTHESQEAPPATYGYTGQTRHWRHAPPTSAHPMQDYADEAARAMGYTPAARSSQRPKRGATQQPTSTMRAAGVPSGGTRRRAKAAVHAPWAPRQQTPAPLEATPAPLSEGSRHTHTQPGNSRKLPKREPAPPASVDPGPVLKHVHRTPRGGPQRDPQLSPSSSGRHYWQRHGTSRQTLPGSGARLVSQIQATPIRALKYDDSRVSKKRGNGNNNNNQNNNRIYDGIAGSSIATSQEVDTTAGFGNDSSAALLLPDAAAAEADAAAERNYSSAAGMVTPNEYAGLRTKALLQGRPLSPDEALERAHRLDRLYELRRALEESRQQRLRQQGGTPPGQQPSTAVALQRPPPLRTTPSRQTMVSTFTALDGRHMRGMSTLDSTPTRTTVQDANDSVAGGLSRGPDLDSYLAHMSQEVAAQQRALYESRQAQRTVEARQAASRLAAEESRATQLHAAHKAHERNVQRAWRRVLEAKLERDLRALQVPSSSRGGARATPKTPQQASVSKPVLQGRSGATAGGAASSSTRRR